MIVIKNYMPYINKAMSEINRILLDELKAQIVDTEKMSALITLSSFFLVNLLGITNMNFT